MWLPLGRPCDRSHPDELGLFGVKHTPTDYSSPPPTHLAESSLQSYLIRKSSLLSLLPFISSRIHTGSIPRPDHFRLFVFLLWYFGFAFARLPVRARDIAGPPGLEALRAT